MRTPSNRAALTITGKFTTQNRQQGFEFEISRRWSSGLVPHGAPSGAVRTPTTYHSETFKAEMVRKLSTALMPSAGRKVSRPAWSTSMRSSRN